MAFTREYAGWVIRNEIPFDAYDLWELNVEWLMSHGVRGRMAERPGRGSWTLDGMPSRRERREAKWESVRTIRASWGRQRSWPLPEGRDRFAKQLDRRKIKEAALIKMADSLEVSILVLA